MKKRLLSICLVLAVLMSLTVPITAGAADVSGDQLQYISGTVQNPLYANVPTPEREDAETQSDEWTEAENKEATYVTPTQAADQLRQAMVNRQSSVTLYITTNDFWRIDGQTNWFTEDFFPMAYSQELAQCPYDGDYLKWSWSQYSWQLMSYSGNRYAFQVELIYYTNASEEAQLARGIEQLAGTLGLANMEPYDAYTEIYDYITSHVDYDYAGLDTIYDSISGNEDYYIFTAYGALMDGEAVCQGYAALYYALCWYVDLPVRIITSYNHAWNIVYLKEIWYNVDSTWDAESYSGRDWYLLGSNNFDGGSHTSEDEYRTEEFRSNYPISPYDYDPAMPFNDVPKTNGHYDNILRATELNLFQGTSTYTFSPGMEITRGMLVTVLWRLNGSPASTRDSGFTDVPQYMYYADAVDWAAENDIVNGMGGSIFSPNGPATREQLVTVLYRYAKYLGEDVSESASLNGFTDQGRVGAFALEPMQWAVGTGLVNGVTPTTLCPQNNTPREQLATLLIRLIDYYGL